MEMRISMNIKLNKIQIHFYLEKKCITVDDFMLETFLLEHFFLFSEKILNTIRIKQTNIHIATGIR